MSNDSEKSPDGNAHGVNADARVEGEDESEEERPTVTPPFDPIAFAKRVLRPTPGGGARSPVTKRSPSTAAEGPAAEEAQDRARDEIPTLTDADELEAARARSASPHENSTVTDASALEAARARSAGIVRSSRPTPDGLLAIANSRVPSNNPPRRESVGAFGAVDREWVELATRPPPAGFAPEDETARAKSAPVRALADADGDDQPTRPPPPLQQQLIDALARGEAPPSSPQSGKAPPPPAAPAAPSHREMNDRVALGDYTGALEMAERLLAVDPDDALATACAESSKSVLRKMYSARLGPLDRVPTVMVARDQLRWLSIDHRAGFVLSLIDGVSSLEMILDVTGMPELDALRILSELAQQRIIAFR